MDSVYVSEENVQTILCMGFPSESEVREALRMAKNDLSDAVAYLTNEPPQNQYNITEDMDVDLRGGVVAVRPPVHGPHLPPAYDEVCNDANTNKTSDVSTMSEGTSMEDSNSLEFPVTNLYELEGRVFTEMWNIPFKREESLGKCLIAARKLVDAGLVEGDEHCKRFLDRCMPEAFQKLLTSNAVTKWPIEIQEGIFNMLGLLVEVIVASLQQPYLEKVMMDCLTLAFNPETEFHIKNQNKRDNRIMWEEKFDGRELPSSSKSSIPFGWLTNLINSFGHQAGFDMIQKHLDNEENDILNMSLLLKPFGVCAEYLNPKLVEVTLRPGMERSVQYIKGLEEKELKKKKMGSVSELLSSMKLLCLQLWPNDVDGLDDLRLEITLRMLKSPHFNAKMNALKEVTKLIDDLDGSSRTVRSSLVIHADKILDWLVANKVLSVALEGNIDQAQYCDKIKGIVDFLGPRLSGDELTMIWKMQNGQTNNVIDNIHSIIAAAAVKFDANQLEQLFRLIEKKWREDTDRIREKLLSLIGKIGKDSKVTKTTTRVLELLWDLSHLRALTTHLVEQALDQHHAILSDSYSVKEQVKTQYIYKCVDDIKKGICVLPAIRQLMAISKNITKQSSQKTDKGVINEVNKSSDVIKLVSHSLVKCHKQALTVLGDLGVLKPTTMVDGRYPHSDYMNTHLSFLRYVLQEGVLYLPWNRARDIWTTLVANPKACEWDRETCYEWFRNGITDLETETQKDMFQKEILRIDSSKLSENGFMCFKCFFEKVNAYEHKLKTVNGTFMVEKTDLIGLDYLWEICLHVPMETIAEQAIQMLLSLSFSNLNAKLKKDPVTLHKRFINECYTRLETAMMGVGGNAVTQTVSTVTKIVTAVLAPDVANVPLPSRSIKYLAIERLLWIAESYILSVEELHSAPRTILPHGASFHGYQISVQVKCESLKQEFTLQCHSNETLGSVRLKVLNRLNHPADHVQMHTNDKLLCSTKDQALLHQLDFGDSNTLQVHLGSNSTSKSGSTGAKTAQTELAFDEPNTKSSSTGLKSEDSGDNVSLSGFRASSLSGSSGSSGSRDDPDKMSASATSKLSYEMEQEKMLPGVVMAKGGEVFDMLYQLTELDEAKITKRVRKLLMLIPTDTAVEDALDQTSLKVQTVKSSTSSSEDISGAKSSPRKTFPSLNTASTPLSPQDSLKCLFDSNHPGMSSFRVLYNLEVLSSKLMPTTEDPSVRGSADDFCVEFLDNGGLTAVVSVLQPEALPADINYEIRQGCYSTCLQLARYLLCGQTVTGETVKESRRCEDMNVSPSCGSAGANSASVSASASSSAAPRPRSVMWSQAVQKLTSQEFVQTVSCFMRVTWAAAAGRLHLLSYNQPIRESREAFTCGHRSRQSSTGSSASTNSDSDCQSLHAGVCNHQVNVPTKDANISKEALEILVTCLQLRKELLSSFYSLPCVSDFIIDILVGCPLPDIRNATLEQLCVLTQVNVRPVDNDHHHHHNHPTNTNTVVPEPRQFILSLLLKAHLPFWVASSNARGSTQKLLTNCSQYFDLRCRLLENLSLSEQSFLSLDVESMLEDEIAWLCNFVPSRHTDLQPIDNTLLAGHIKLIRTLLTCEGVQKAEMGGSLVSDLLHDFLFPASKLMLDSMNQPTADSNLVEFNPKCSYAESRVAAYELLTELSNRCLPNLHLICKELLLMHHQLTENPKEWEYMPPVNGRAGCGYVGLKNGGATCYMNSVLQQLYMTPGIPEAVLSIDEDQPDEDTVFYQIQQMFGHLMESKLQHHEPEKFWQVFKLWGHTVNIREQQDAFDFFQAVLDQIDEYMKKIGKAEIFKNKFQGIFSDQKICKDCPHRYEREEAFIALNLTVKNATLQDSLDQFVKGELLEGANAYFCEKCGEKRNTIKRMCIKSLPPLLCIQLKRFGYDWEANRALKFDDYFKFPWTLDMEPYTVEGMARRELDQSERQSLSSEGDTQSMHSGDGDAASAMETNLNGGEGGGVGGGGGAEGPTEAASLVPDSTPIHYDLVGIVVHSGQANAGHYYSYIRDRRGTALTNPNKGKWFKFNDTLVEEFDLNDSAVEQECFGGTYKAKVYDSSNTYPEDRLRYWNGYLLFYEKSEDLRSPFTAKRSKIISRRVLPEGGKRSLNSDSLMELTELVHKGERKGIFMDKMPASIQQVIHAENITFVKNRDIYNSDYFFFIRQLIDRNKDYTSHPDYEEMCIQALQLGVRFLFNTYLRNSLKSVSELEEWVSLLDTMMCSCKAACLWVVDFFAGTEGREMVRPFLLECPNKDVRVMMQRVLEKMMHNFFHHGGVPTHASFNSVIEHLFHLLDKDAVDLVKNSTQFFLVLRCYIMMGTKACSHTFGRGGFQRLATFLLGSSDSGLRRWSSIQSREFAHLHTALSVLILNCNVQVFRTHERDTFDDRKPVTVLPHIFLKMPPSMSAYVFGDKANWYLKEVVLAVRELAGGNLLSMFDMILHCCFCNEHFSRTVLRHLMSQYSSAPSNELKPIFSLLTDILTLEDPLQTTRLQWVFDGLVDDSSKMFEGLTAIIRLNHVSDSRRSYQCIKFMVALMTKSTVAKDFLLKSPVKWQWSVNWLKKKMTEHYWSTTSSANLSNEDSNRKSFQRTQSAQYTLQEATAFLTEMENYEMSNAGLDGNGSSSGSSSAGGGNSNNNNIAGGSGGSGGGGGGGSGGGGSNEVVPMQVVPSCGTTTTHTVVQAGGSGSVSGGGGGVSGGGSSVSGSGGGGGGVTTSSSSSSSSSSVFTTSTSTTSSSVTSVMTPSSSEDSGGGGGGGGGGGSSSSTQTGGDLNLEID